MHRLDNIEDWTLPPVQESRFSNDLSAGRVVWFGLEHLYQNVLTCEQDYAKQFGSPTECRSPEPRQAALLARCTFDWYAVSACNLVSLIGWIANQAGLTEEDHKRYLTRVLPAVEIHRNKIAAHFSRHSPKNDSYALQQASTMLFSLPWVNGHFVANAWKLGIRRKGVASDSSVLVPWSVVEIHKTLRRRYAAS